jgi:gluconokinase
MIVLLMGVSGAGKTTLGERLAKRLAWPFIDADDYHPAANVAKMAAGIALDDDDRWPWLDALNRRLREERDAVVACSALKASYRERLLAGIVDARVVFLHGAQTLIAARLAERKHRYMPASLLESQFAALEPPPQAITIDVAGEPAACVEAIARAISRAA